MISHLFYIYVFIENTSSQKRDMEGSLYNYNNVMAKSPEKFVGTTWSSFLVVLHN